MNFLKNISDKKKVSITILFVYAILLFLLLSCTVLNKATKDKTQSKEITKKEAKTTHEVNSTLDKTVFNFEAYNFSLEPINTNKDVGIYKDGKTTWYRNAKPTWKKEKSRTNRNITKSKTAQTNKNTEEKKEETTTETETKKFKISLPWYAYFFIGLFALLFYFLWKIFKKLSILTPS